MMSESSHSVDAHHCSSFINGKFAEGHGDFTTSMAAVAVTVAVDASWQCRMCFLQNTLASIKYFWSEVAMPIAIDRIFEKFK